MAGGMNFRCWELVRFVFKNNVDIEAGHVYLSRVFRSPYECRSRCRVKSL